MSDWAAKLLRNPNRVPGANTPVSQGQSKSQVANEKGSLSASGLGPAKPKSHGANEALKLPEEPQKTSKTEDTRKVHTHEESQKASKVGEPEKATKAEEPRKASKDGEPENSAKAEEPFKADPYNYSEVLQFLHARFERDEAEAKRDKDSENAVIYRSLDSASAWNTSSTSSKKNSDEDGFNLLRELNRSNSKARKL